MYIDTRILGSRGCIATGNGPKNSWGKFPEKKRKQRENNTTCIQYGWKRGAWISKPPRFQRPPPKKSTNHLLQGLACPGNCTDSPIQCGSVFSYRWNRWNMYSLTGVSFNPHHLQIATTNEAVAYKCNKSNEKQDARSSPMAGAPSHWKQAHENM